MILLIMNVLNVNKDIIFQMIKKLVLVIQIKILNIKQL